MNSTSSLDFGLFIAFFVPGFVAFYAISFVSADARAILDLSLTPGAGIGAELGIALFSIGAGIIVSAFRDLILDRIQRATGVQHFPLDCTELKKADTLAAYKEAINNTYRYAQFYGNTFVASLLLVAVRVYEGARFGDGWLVTAILIVGLVCLFIAHRTTLKQTYQAQHQILS